MVGDEGDDTGKFVMSFDDSDCFRYSTMSGHDGVVMTLNDFGLFGEWDDNSVVTPNTTVMKNGRVN